MKKILVTGCNGQLGRAINQVYANDTCEIINTDVAELDITDVECVVKMAKEVKPNVIINCAAHTNVNACETQEELAYKINAIGPRNLSIAATEVGAKMIHISTDYVFDGNNDVPYVEWDKTNPQSVYGRTKLAGEQFVQMFSKEYFIIRAAWLYGDGKNFLRTMLNLAETNDAVRVVKDQFGTPTSATELARMIHYLEPTYNYGTFHGTCEGSCSWAEFTREIFRLKGLTTEVIGITTEEYPTPAQRPKYSVLENAMLKMTTNFTMKDWQEALREYMKDN